jgi:hypothetical protein
MADAAGSQPPSSHRPLVEVLVTGDCPHRDAAIALVRRVSAPLAEEEWLGHALRNAEVQP